MTDSFAKSDHSIGSITSIFERLRAGDMDSAKQLWDRFFPRLHGLARKVLAGRELPASAEDAVQTAFFNFFRRVQQGECDDISGRDELWKLLSMMTAQIASKQQRAEHAKKRGAGRTVLEADLGDRLDLVAHLDQLLGPIAPPECDLICEELLNQLDDDVREVALLRLAGYTNLEIKVLAGYPLRSIERRVQLIRAVWAEHVKQ